MQAPTAGTPPCPRQKAPRELGPVDNYRSQTIMQAMQIMEKKAWAVLS